MKPLFFTVAAIAVSWLVVAPGLASAAGAYDPGASDSEIKIGNTWSYSGPASGNSTIAREMAGYFKSVNDMGGVNGRKIVFDSLDDGYSPPKTVEDTRRLVEEDRVLLMFGQLGTPTNMAVRTYLNGRKVPQLFVTTGSNSLIDPKRYPWTMGLQASYALESIVFAKYILAERPNAKIGILYQDDDFGGDHLDPFIAALGPKASSMIVAKASYAVTDPTLTSQIISLESAGADTLYLITQGRAAPQAVTTARQQGGRDALIFVPFVATAKSIIGPAGDDNLKGVIATDSEMDPTDPAWANDPGVRDYLAWVKKYVPAQDQESDSSNPGGYVPAEALVEVLKRCGDVLTRDNVMKVATSLHDMTLPLLLPGVMLNTSSDNYFPMHSVQLKQYDGKRWVLIGKPISG
ncbi:MAG TPA: ABC transporter substrate-binding protein [Stellaceae bacterium]|nr:ABC transporter substrate-binding protein [Stellaceae bacterium]